MDRDETTLVEIREAARSSVRIGASSDRERLADDQVIRYAILYAIIIMGEAVKRLSDSFRAEHPDIPWGRICGMHDRVVHAYVVSTSISSGPWPLPTPLPSSRHSTC